MPSIETTDWLALKSHIDTLVTSPVMQCFEPGAIVTPPVQTETNWEGGETWSNGEGWDGKNLPMPFILLSDVTNDPVRMGIDPRLHVRSGTLMLALQWPIARAVTHTQLKEVAGQIAAHFSADTCMTFGPSRLRVTQDAAAMQSYIDGAYRVSVVRVLWSSM
jgi:hypothetical protein